MEVHIQLSSHGAAVKLMNRVRRLNIEASTVHNRVIAMPLLKMERRALELMGFTPVLLMAGKPADYSVKSKAVRDAVLGELREAVVA